MKKAIVLSLMLLSAFGIAFSQEKKPSERIDIMLINGEFRKAADTCKIILASDSLNPSIFYKMGAAYQNLMVEDSSITSYEKAVKLDPGNRTYSYSLAKAYYAAGKNKAAEPLFRKLVDSDTTFWAWSSFLSSIYMQTGKYENAIAIYERFLKKDSGNNTFLDKTAFAYQKKGEFERAINLYNRSLALKTNDLFALRNVAFLYAVTYSADTAVTLLSRGIKIDSSDVDLRIRRAQLYYLLHYTKRALDDYMVVLASGDSSTLYLKRIGIGYCYNLQPKVAIPFLLKAYKADSSDCETCSYLGQSYYKTKDFKASKRYYKKAIDILVPFKAQLRLTYEQYGDSQQSNMDFNDAIESYLNAYSISYDTRYYMVIANIYDEKLNNREKAIMYYEKFLAGQKTAKAKYPDDYLLKVEKRLNFLKEGIKPKPPVTTK